MRSVIPMIFSCATTNSASTAYCLFGRRLPFSRRHIDVIAVNLSQRSNERLDDTPAPPPSDKNWFVDGREAARQLKMDLGIVSKDEGNASLDSESKGGEDANKFAISDAILESGRAAAREFLSDMNANESETYGVGDKSTEIVTIENEATQPLESYSNGDLDTKSEESIQSPPDDQYSEDYFNMPSRKSHCMTICFVPPCAATKAWEKLMAARKECKDPGFFRWPPHANILYPFLEPVYNNDGEDSKGDQRAKFRNEIAVHLSRAAKECQPFNVTIDSFGTFGGKHRGVLWAYPQSNYGQDGVSEKYDEEPLVALQSMLEQQFPMCKDQRKNGVFHPHMTISHYSNNDDALTAKIEVESKWEPVSFHVPEIYLLERKGDDGQFKIAATIPLGAGSVVELHDPPLPFLAMPSVEEKWVCDERMAMKDRRKMGNVRRKRGERSIGKNQHEERVDNKS
mmetsp:Transcript_5219/g.13054  ORF Transcript_5219/g.13054 Transcript_5219/m.13054 type:complete len:455 (-) Transcript_5219:498-1862(-)